MLKKLTMENKNLFYDTLNIMQKWSQDKLTHLFS